MHTPEEDQRAEETTATHRIEQVQRVTEASLAFLNFDDLLSELLDRVVDTLRADTAAILLVDESGGTLRARAAKGLEEEVKRGFQLPVGRGFAGRVAATRRPVVIPDLDRAPVELVNPLFRERGVHSLLGVPLIVERRLVGVLHVGTLRPRDFGAEDTELLQLVADRAALAIENARLTEQQRIAHVLQRTLLPRELPSVPGLRMAGRYIPAATGTAVGGDWYDVVELDGGRVGFAIGDVVGKGVEAAVQMGTFRNALRAYAMEGLAPGEVVSKLSRFADAQRDGGMATLIYGTLDGERTTMTIARAGHPVPLMIRPDGRTEYLRTEGGPPLGSGLSRPYSQRALPIESGCTVLLYTDGLIERRGRRLVDGESALANAGAAAPADPEPLCSAVIADMTTEETISDDIAVLAIRSVDAGNPLSLEVPAVPGRLSDVRRILRHWLAAAGVVEDDIAATTLSCGEACSNVIEHAYGPSDATLRVTAELGRESVAITVRDQGAWRSPRRRADSRGIMIMESYMDEVRIDPTEEGTTVRLLRNLTGSVREPAR